MTTGSDYLLIVEDDPDILKLLQTTLTFKGYRVITARNDGRAGYPSGGAPGDRDCRYHDAKIGRLRSCSSNAPCPETCDIPVVFITATYVAPEDKEFALDIGATRFLQKPVDLDAFLKTVASCWRWACRLTWSRCANKVFYDGYRKRLQTKLDQKNKQIAREEHLLKTRLDEDNDDLLASLRHAIDEREEIKLLLDQVQEQIEKLGNTG